ncbi:quaternary amine ABC transporter ATP-binding protein [Desertibacillus haloalkaliphilus]|uniref:quaternary amine ABC transporter ATP-binding protein n=1 Tax=Desertibacillus haloalkaliphilus TaxID=1328930 RepID=UPI001C25D74F|nr:glycine betaine/L-proline ABC transporter ATP-binding protein [Desertibacillus haloalkaliphilus]MBU8908911.1 glycine betaine/L-proline ABC transporter ATP-binding protein [Desertibacillus haloalkaliphilus]
MNKIEANDVFKIFGSNPKEGLKRVKEGQGKQEILKETGMTVGVNNASFSVKAGEFFVIMGLSGSGKSTLIRLVNRLIDPTAGEILIDGEDLTKMDKTELMQVRRKKLGMVFQRFALFQHRTILKNVEYGLEVQDFPKKEREERARKAIKDVGLSGYEESYPDQLSGGMQQRVGLARALANETDILLMDEAFSALDPLIRKDMQDELLQLQRNLNKTILFITHDLDEALKLGDRIAMMKDGEIVQIGTAEEIMSNPANDYVSTFVQDVDRSKVLLASNVMKKPDVLTTVKEGPHVAVRRMEEKGISSIFVVDKDQMLKGLLTIDEAVQGVKEKLPVEDLLVGTYPTTSPETPLHELIGVAAEAKYPIAVVEDGKLLGIIVRVSILSGLALGKEADEEVIIA